MPTELFMNSVNRAGERERIAMFHALDRRREAQGRTVDELAGAAGIAARGYYRLRAGQCVPRVGTLRRLERALRVLDREMLA